MNLCYITPATPDELTACLPAVEFLWHFIPKSIREGDPEEVMRNSAGEITVVYLQGVPIAMFHIEGFRRSAEIHGVARQDLPSLIGKRPASALINQIGTHILEKLFFEQNKEVVVAKIPQDSKGGLGFVRKWGFESMQKTDQKRAVYRLSQRQFFKRYASSVIR